LATTHRKTLLAATRLDGKAKVKKDLADALAKIDARQSVYAVVLFSKDLKKMLSDANPMAAAVLDKLIGLSGSINVTDSLEVSVNVHVSDPMLAKALAAQAEALKGALAVLKTVAPDFAPLADELDKTLKITADKNRVAISFKIGAEVIEK